MGPDSNTLPADMCTEVDRDAVLGVGPWLCLRTKPESLVLALKFESLLTSLEMEWCIQQ